MIRFPCAWCGVMTARPAGHVNRSRATGLYLYCGRKCAGLGRRIEKSKEQKVAEKRAYDMEYRRKNRAVLKAKKAAYFQQTYNPAKAAVERKARMPRHVEYCRRPEYRAKKHEYDVRRYHEGNYGPFAEASMLLQDLEAEIACRMSRYEIYMANGTINKRLRRRRENEVTQRG